MAKKAIESVQDERDSKLYEFAFHLVPKMSEEEALAAFTDIKNQITASGATVKSESAPALLNLAYRMDIVVDSVKHKYSQAYFAWFVFEATGEQALAFKDEVKFRKDMIRSLLITTKNESPIPSADVAKALASDEEEQPAEVQEETQPQAEGDAQAQEAKGSEESEEDKKVDEAIDKLVN